MARKVTKNVTSFTRPRNVTYNFSLDHAVTTIILPPSSSWTSGLHWHTSHTEFLQVISGTALLTLSSHTRTLTPSDGAVHINPGIRHEWRRATTAHTSATHGLDLVVKEWTTPMDGQKEIFFRNLSSILEEDSSEGLVGESWATLQLLVVMLGMDNYPVYFSVGGGELGRLVEWIVTMTILWTAKMIGLGFGLNRFYEEYTPDEMVRRKKNI